MSPPSLTAAPSLRVTSRRSWGGSRPGTPVQCAPTGVSFYSNCDGDWKFTFYICSESVLGAHQWMSLITRTRTSLRWRTYWLASSCSTSPRGRRWRKLKRTFSKSNHFRRKREFRRPTAGPRLSQDKFPDWVIIMENTVIILLSTERILLVQ